VQYEIPHQRGPTFARKDFLIQSGGILLVRFDLRHDFVYKIRHVYSPVVKKLNISVMQRTPGRTLLD